MRVTLTPLLPTEFLLKFSTQITENAKLFYSIIFSQLTCEKRFKANAVKYHKQLNKEASLQVNLQRTAFDAIKHNMLFANGVLTINYDKVSKFTKSEKRRLEEILEMESSYNIY